MTKGRLIYADALLKMIRPDDEEDSQAAVLISDVKKIFRKQIDNAPTIDAVPVVRCGECVSHGNCLTEDVFRIARIENPYCCGGKRREVDGE